MQTKAAVQRRVRRHTQVRNVGPTYMDYTNALPVDMRDKLKFNRVVQAKHYKLSRWIETTGRHVLKKREVRVLQFIIARTIPFGKTAERILASHFQKGIFDDKTGECIQARWGGNNDDWYSAVKILESSGMVIVHPVSSGGKTLGTIYEIALDFILNITIPGDSMSALRQPRKVRQQRQQQQTAELIDFGAVLLRKNGKLGCSLSDTYTAVPDVRKGTREHKEVNLEIEEPLDAPLAVQETDSRAIVKRVRRKPRTVQNALDCNTVIRRVIDVAAAKSAAVRENRITSSGIGIQATYNEITAAWRQAVVDTQGHCPVVGLTKAEFGRFRSSAKAHAITFSWYDFFYWCSTSWGYLNKLYSETSARRKADNGDRSFHPEDIYLGSPTPQLSKVVVNFGKLIKAYADANSPKAKMVDTEENTAKALRDELARVKAENDKLRKQIASPSTLQDRKVPRRVQEPIPKIGTPESIDEEDDALPEWR